MEHQYNLLPKTLSIDNEMANNKFKEYYDMKGIKLNINTIKQSQENGTAEHSNRTLAGMMRFILKKYEMSDGFWSYAEISAVENLNNISKARINWKSTNEMLNIQDNKWYQKQIMSDVIFVVSNNSKKLRKLEDRWFKVKYLCRAHDGFDHLVFHTDNCKIHIVINIMEFN